MIYAESDTSNIKIVTVVSTVVETMAVSVSPPKKKKRKRKERKKVSEYHYYVD